MMMPALPRTTMPVGNGPIVPMYRASSSAFAGSSWMADSYVPALTNANTSSTPVSSSVAKTQSVAVAGWHPLPAFSTTVADDNLGSCNSGLTVSGSGSGSGSGSVCSLSAVCGGVVGTSGSASVDASNGGSAEVTVVEGSSGNVDAGSGSGSTTEEVVVGTPEVAVLEVVRSRALGAVIDGESVADSRPTAVAATTAAAATEATTPRAQKNHPRVTRGKPRRSSRKASDAALEELNCRPLP